MAVLPANQRTSCFDQLMQDISYDRESLGALTKADLKAAVDAADDWVNSNTASYNSTLPLTARSVLTAKQKARLLLAIIKFRYINGL